MDSFNETRAYVQQLDAADALAPIPKAQLNWYNISDIDTI